jgi:tetratricopeptide (TPR) repeat protein
LIRSRKAVTILNAVLKLEPDNPGVMHFIIHASDNPRMAPLGLEAARRYARIAPASAHALHMPSHIFARLGLWQEDIKSNLASKAAAESHTSLHIGAQNRLHAMEFLQYAYLQIGRDDEAQAIANEAVEIQPGELDPGFEDYYPWVEASFPARLALETRDWAGAQALAAGTTPRAQKVTYWAHAVAAGNLRDRWAAEHAAAAYRATLTSAQLAADEAQPSAQSAETRAWALFAGGDVAGAVALLRPVADHQDKVGKGEVELPAREMLADMLRLAGHRAEALQEYRVSLQTDPGRFNTLLHAGEVAAELGLRQQAADYYRLLLENASNPSVKSQQALGKARSFLQPAASRQVETTPAK